ncbi:MAG: hypothetical protein ACYCYF_04695 [Anaerolineae bacterium]
MNKQVWLIALLVVLLVAGSGCFLTNLVESVLSPGGNGDGGLIEIEIPTPQRVTIYPTLTPNLVLEPTRTSATPAATKDKSFRLELSESDVSAMVGEKGFSAQGLQISNLRTTITPEQVIATFDASHAETGLSGEMTVVGVPRVVQDKVYLEVIDFTLGRTFSGFTRLIATALVKSVLDSYNTGNGIPVPIDDAGEITGVELFAGKMVVTGTYR